MNVLQVISLCLACFSLGISVSGLIWTWPFEKKNKRDKKDK